MVGEEDPSKCKVATQYLDYVEFAGVVANRRVFRGNNGKYITFVTLGIGPGEYIDMAALKSFSQQR